MGQVLLLFVRNTLSFFLLCLLLAGCQFSIEGPILPGEELKVNEIVAFGDGYFAGFTNTERSGLSLNATSGLYQNAQIYSIPRLIVSRYNELRDTLGYQPIAFPQPLAFGNGSGYLQASGINTSPCDNLPSYAKLEKNGALPDWQLAADASFNNLAFPYLNCRMLNDAQLFNQNPFVGRVFPNNTQSLRALGAQADADFFVMWIGMNEVLPYALAGGEGSGQSMVSPDDFRAECEEFVRSLVASGKKGMIATIPDITRFPYFQTVPRTYVDFEKCGAIPRSLYIESWEDSSLVVRTASPNDQILLHAHSTIGQGESPDIYGINENMPVKHQEVLDIVEINKIRLNIAAYNTTLVDLVSRINQEQEEATLAIVRLDRTFDAMMDGKFETGVYVSGEHLTGGIFNLDGLYLTPRGNALLANQFIRTISTFPGFPGTLPLNNLKDFAGVSFP
ncbi:MAG: hypothetical protein AAFQ87_00530 [Bacteroidota bacterium]